MSRDIKKVVVIGTGVIGASWCAFYLAKGLDVVATDIAPTAKASLDAYINAAWPMLEELGLSPGASLNRLGFDSVLDTALKGADLVQECGPERIDFKQDLYRHMDEILPPDVIIASSSSGLTMTDIQAKCEKHPERCVIGHPFNPPHIIPLVEVVGGAKTSEETIARAMAFYASLGKKPIRLFKALAGHVANRFQAALYKEMLYLIEEGVLSVEDADVAVSYGPGLRWGVMGQSLQWHLGGGAGGIDHFMEHLMTPLQGIMKTLGEPKVDDKLKKDVIAGVQAQLKGRSVDELADAENRVILGALALRQKVGLA
ncbi:3-hydroxyacyl-CoA dehydrogenase NAD-binding domain-containing protein [Pinirhizobacter soli]|uniref:3-hydroxyacyl-CoA dehydrogenase NAD-binding domain-containing protein n=1 Tax=Pinirhizobacter soli TaxID=2786953 RepID=UPI00202A2DB3|nr:3-hydroxyacyl-CoA dehydrogenase NAD-binding domain-containing protein [Pinirhizobacter soli]